MTPEERIEELEQEGGRVRKHLDTVLSTAPTQPYDPIVPRDPDEEGPAELYDPHGLLSETPDPAPERVRTPRGISDPLGLLDVDRRSADPDADLLPGFGLGADPELRAAVRDLALAYDSIRRSTVFLLRRTWPGALVVLAVSAVLAFGGALVGAGTVAALEVLR